jgi:hypothetical protein
MKNSISSGKIPKKPKVTKEAFLAYQKAKKQKADLGFIAEQSGLGEEMVYEIMMNYKRFTNKYLGVEVPA